MIFLLVNLFEFSAISSTTYEIKYKEITLRVCRQFVAVNLSSQMTGITGVILSALLSGSSGDSKNSVIV